MVEKFKDRFIQACRQKGIKQIQIADKTGLSRGLINDYIKGRSTPKSKNLYKIASILEVSPSWLMGFDTPMYDDDYSLNNKIKDKLQNLTIEELGKVLQMLDLMFPNKEGDDKK